MRTIHRALENQPKIRDTRHSTRAFCFSWLAIILLATGGIATADTIQIQVGGGGNAFFDPDDVTIHQGDTVEWVWGDSKFGHSVTSGANGVSDGLFDSGVQPDPFTFTRTFPNTGTFHYYCQPHFAMGMMGVIRVVEGTTTPAAFGNISTRLRVETGNNVLIGGFIVTGTQPKKIIVRAIGPSLASFFSGVLADPFLELRDSSGGLIASNDNWRTTQEAEIIATTVPPSDNLESAIVATLPANNSAYTAIVQGNNGTGIGVVEAYDLDRTVDSKLANISTRGLVQTNNDVLIGGLIVLGQGSLRVIVRAIGPSLTPLGIAGALGDPTLELHDGNGALIVANDNWRTDQEAEIIATTVPPTSDLESAIVRDMAPGNYTAIVRGVNNTTGIAVVEAFGLN